MTPQELLVRLRDPDCDCCPLYEKCQSYQTETACLLLEEAANCIENLLQKGNR